MAEKQQLIKIVRELQSGNKNMAAVLYEAYYRDLHYYILKRVNDPEKAEALTQDTFIEILDLIDALDNADEFVEWSRQIADRRCNLYKKLRRELLLGKVGASVVDSVRDERKEIYAEQDAVEKSELPVCEMMDTLSEEQKVSILSNYIEKKKTDGVQKATLAAGIWAAIEPFLRKLLVGVIVAALLAMIKDIGIGWTHKSTQATVDEAETFSAAEVIEEHSSLEEAEQLEENSSVEEMEIPEVSSSAEETQAPEASSSAEETQTPEASSSIEQTDKPTGEIKPTEALESTELIESTQPNDEITGSAGLEYTHVGSYYEVSGVGSCTDDIIVIPEMYKGLPVGAIGMYAFSDCSATGIILPDSIQFIEGGAFAGCKQLVDLKIPDSVISIGDAAFVGCESLTEISIPKTQTKIGMQMFAGCHKLKDVVIPEGVESIGWEAFAFCHSLNSIDIPASVSGIEGSSFYQCTALSEITVDAANPVYYSVNNCVVTKGSKKLCIGCCGSVIPADGSVTQIGDYAFVACNRWNSVNIPEGITKIGKSAFEAVPLKHIIIPKSVISIGDRALFNGCTLETIAYVGTRAEWELIEKGAEWDESAGNYELLCIGAETLEYRRSDTGYEVAGIGSYTKTELVIPQDHQGLSVVAIGNSAFHNANLTGIVFPDGLVRIEEFAFVGCSELTTVVFPNDLSHIGQAAFNLSGLTGIVIPASVTTIGRDAFSGCPLKSISVDTLNSVYYSEGNCLISKVSKTLVQGCENSVIPTDGSILKIGESAFSYYKNFNDIVIPEGVVSIGEGAFSFCSLKSVTIPESVTEIGNSAFWENRELKTIHYGGTKETWRAIEKGTEWDGFTGSYTVYCTDGEIKK